MQIGTLEFIVIVLVAFLVLGPDRTARYAKRLGKGLRVVKVYMESLSEDLQDSVVEPVREIKKPLQQMAQPITDLKRAVQAPADELNKSLQKSLQNLKKSVQTNAAERAGVQESGQSGIDVEMES